MLWKANECPRAVIEVKNRVYNIHDYEKDIIRIAQFLKRKPEENSLEFGLFTFYTGVDWKEGEEPSEKIEQRFNTIRENLSNKILRDDFKYDLHERLSNDGSWASACIVIKR